MKHSQKLLATLCLLTLASCGAKSGGSSHKQAEDNGSRENQIAEGTYKAILRPTSFTLSGWIPSAVADIKISGDNVEVKAWMDDSGNVTHMMSIHAGTRCPELSDDTNGDGFVDYKEMVKVSKKALVPLDGNLNVQMDGTNGYPKGNFTYYQTGSLAAMMDDLNRSDINLDDHIIKLRGGENLNLEGRVVVVSGVVANRPLPASVGTINGLTPQASVPISCGVIMRMQ